MPSLFHRRSRSLSTARPQTQASSSAHLAASQAFLNNRVSQGNLSASAAAAALRTMSPPPTDVGEVQTKRMQRRSSSAGSGNATRGRSRGSLERQSSSGSMTERTFRSPSPGRPQSAGGLGAAPPVPKLPQDIPPVPKLKERNSRRALSENPRAAKASTAATTPALAAAALSVRSNGANGATGPNTLQRTDSKNSINFSYPRPQSPPPQSSATSSPVQQKSGPNGISSFEAGRVQYNVSAASQQPVKKKKKAAAPGAAQGSHLSAGSMASKPVVTPLEPGPEISPDTTPQPVKKKKKKVALTGQSTHFPSTEDANDDQEPDMTPEQIRRAQRASGVLMKQPSVVREDWEGEQEDEPSPTDAQQREAQGLSPVASPAAPIQTKKTTAANMSRKIEEPTSPTPKTETEPVPAVAQPLESGKQHLAVAQPDQMRQVSRSPSRSTRFSDNLASDLSSGVKHEPLPRSVSPVKSALKHHSPSPAGGRRARAISPSEGSESNLSAEGSVRRKKSARVSFEPEAEVVGVAAESVGADSPVVASPQNQENKKGGIFSFGRSRPVLTTIPSEDDLDDHMKPRPQLPSFGSVRNKNRRVDSSDSVELTSAAKANKQLSPPAQSSATSSDSSSPNIATQEQGASSDHAVGALLAQHATQNAAKQHDPTLPLPPEVTSREGGYFSDSESNYSQDADDLMPTPAMESSELYSTTAESSGAPETAHEASVLKDVAAENSLIANMPRSAPEQVPQLELQPPTPGHDNMTPSDQWLVEVPGGFPGAVNEEKPRSNAFAQAAQVSSTAGSEPRRTFGPSQAELARAQPMEESEDEVSDNDSIYSDAAEEPEGDGFGSINAIMGSPIIPSSARDSPAQSPLASRSEHRPAEAARTTSWDETHQHWKGIAQQSRDIQTAAPQQATQQLQDVTSAPKPASKPVTRAAAPPTVQQTTAQGPVPTVKKPKAKKATGPAAIGAAVAAIPASQRPQPAEVKPQHAMKSSMRQGGHGMEGGGGASTMRTSMRQQADKPHAKSLQASKWANESSRPKSPAQAIVPAGPPKAALQKKHIPPASNAPPTKYTPKPAPALTGNDSDSDSSFKKARRARRPNDGSYSMRSSMRGPASAPTAPQPAGRGAVRSLSPPVRRPFSPAGGMRTSMRGSMDAAAPTLRQAPPEKRSSSLFGRSKAKSTERAVPLPLTSKLRSKFDDSDDEDGPRPTTFRSRFADSSDEEDDVQPLRPVRGIPKRQDDGDSTDLADSSDEEKKRKKRQLQPAIKIDTAAAQRVAPAPDVPLSPNTMKKRGLFGRFRSKSKQDTSLKLQSSPQPSTSQLTRPAPAKRGASDDGDTPFDSNMGFANSAERDDMIRQTMAKLEAAKSTEALSVPSTPPQKTPQTPPLQRPQSPTGGKLQRRRPERIMSDSWPLPESPATPQAQDRPSTAGASPATSAKQKVNGVSTLRPTNERRPTSETFATDGGSPTTAGKSKKKRFPMLRKAFGLKD